MFFIGLAENLVRTIEQGRLRALLSFKHWPWMLLILLVELFTFRNNIVAPYFSDAAARLLISAQLLGILWIANANIQRVSSKLLMVGAVLNLLVITANGGLMPVTPELVHQIYPDEPTGSWYVGERLGAEKAVVLEKEDTALWILSDIFLMPTWLPTQRAISLGDIFIVVGFILIILEIGRFQRITTTE